MADDSNKPFSPARPRLGARPFVGHDQEGRAKAIETFVVPPFNPPGSRSSRDTPAVEQGEADRATLTETETAPTDVPTDPIDGLDRVRATLDEALAQFALSESERPPAEAPFPEFDEAQPGDWRPTTYAMLARAPNAPAPRAGHGDREEDSGGSTTEDERDIAVRDPLDREFVPSGLAGMAAAGEALREAVAHAEVFAEGAELALVLEALARRVRNGEIVVPPGAGSRNEAAVLAAVLASLLGDRA